MALFLVWHDEESVIAPELRLALDLFELRPGLVLVDSEVQLSLLYHRIKWALPPGGALLVAPLGSAPKFKRMEKGALKWLRNRPGASQSALGAGEAGTTASDEDPLSFTRINNLDQRDSAERPAPSIRFDTRPKQRRSGR
ncbi:MAG TPA: hypothetical protein VF548_15550 [Allosphingosinicella sp.]|jgi:hypothetical protein